MKVTYNLVYIRNSINIEQKKFVVEKYTKSLRIENIIIDISFEYIQTYEYPDFNYFMVILLLLKFIMHY